MPLTACCLILLVCGDEVVKPKDVLPVCKSFYSMDRTIRGLSPGRSKKFISSPRLLRPALDPGFSPWPGHEADHLPPSNANVTNEWHYTSTPHVRLYDKYKDNFTIYRSMPLVHILKHQVPILFSTCMLHVSAMSCFLTSPFVTNYDMQ
jgi:hypothetical protein